jgi:hypothetical protein
VNPTRTGRRTLIRRFGVFALLDSLSADFKQSQVDRTPTPAPHLTYHCTHLTSYCTLSHISLHPIPHLIAPYPTSHCPTSHLIAPYPTSHCTLSHISLPHLTSHCTLSHISLHPIPHLIAPTSHLIAPHLTSRLVSALIDSGLLKIMIFQSAPTRLCPQRPRPRENASRMTCR